ncbi:hypothetical protein [Acutalibacter sp. 1XD8-36]|uniref:hypothetical protein n=1 Tax=Acutalibacter sp. 1XD8-36 TaxID=2320852 RepID=UPI00260449E6|nr:hypothetical protein [Acutalibacter sp. 1XD8-36]
MDGNLSTLVKENSGVNSIRTKQSKYPISTDFTPNFLMKLGFFLRRCTETRIKVLKMKAVIKEKIVKDISSISLL